MTTQVQPEWFERDSTMVCQHGTACDVHCCFCHSGFLFDGMSHDELCPARTFEWYPARKENQQ